MKTKKQINKKIKRLQREATNISVYKKMTNNDLSNIIKDLMIGPIKYPVFLQLGGITIMNDGKELYAKTDKGFLKINRKKFVSQQKIELEEDVKTNI